MIDINKYKGHTEGPWNLTPEGHIVADDMTVVCNKHTKRIVETNHKDTQLIADAPLLLQEVKRLREDNKKLHDAINGCAYANMQGSALDLYCESMVERCPTCDENVESGLCDEECEEE